MARPLRIEFEGALYHVTSRGNARQDIYLESQDYLLFLDTLGDVCKRYNWLIHAYCLMTNHYHLVVETPEGNLSLGMRQLNGVYTQRFNRKRGRSGHVFQGRFKSILVDSDTYYKTLIRYVIQNPLRAKMVNQVSQYNWSSYPVMVGRCNSPDWLVRKTVLARFAKSEAKAIELFKQYVEQKSEADFWQAITHQIFLGDETFAKRYLPSENDLPVIDEIPNVQQRRQAESLAYYQKTFPKRSEAIVVAYRSGGYTQKKIADYFGLHYTTVSRIIKKADNA
ncbi:addiction module toxin RelE [Saccharobesus litoralis]|uniref:Addiction module toxin RelE n=1 Tax=Saccharobesus litoralis TaxID=2172099 RepID=A0A2S0VVS7_9ALTE|nr:transposase [Saccharobesus litoralis]AWB68308.1 addiction module toxin RelE [Saccharobesus litoralis]